MDSIHISWNKLLSKLLLFSPALKEGPYPKETNSAGRPEPHILTMPSPRVQIERWKKAK